jgi:hypothetical protein
LILDVRLLSQQAINILQSLWNDLDLTLQSEVSPIIVLQRTDKESWQSVRYTNILLGIFINKIFVLETTGIIRF